MGLNLWLISCTQHIIGASLSEPHNDHDNGPCVENNCIWVSMYYLPRVLSYTCFQDPWSRNAPCILVCCCGSRAWCQDSKNLSLIHIVCCKDCQDWQEGKCAETWSLLRQRSCSDPATCHHATTDVLTYCCFRYMHDTEGLLLCLHVVQWGGITGNAGL